MTPDEIARLEKQLTQFQACRAAAGLGPPDEPVSPKDAQRFAEELLLCLTATAAMQQMRGHPEQTKAFERMATVFLKLAPNVGVGRSRRVPAGAIFFELAEAVQDYAQTLRDNFPQQFD